VRAAASASCSSRGRLVIWRRRPLVHSWRAGQGRHAVAGQDTAIASSWRGRHGVRVLLAIPCGQVACRASKSKANAALSYPAPALAWAELSSRSGLTSVIPKTRAAWMFSSADG
jgi:hypothetical protein